MPITREEFESGAWNIETAVVTFLRQNMELAYTAEELVFELEDFGLDPGLPATEQALSDLVRRGYVEARRRGEHLYYRYDRSIGFRPPAR